MNNEKNDFVFVLFLFYSRHFEKESEYVILTIRPLCTPMSVGSAKEV